MRPRTFVAVAFFLIAVCHGSRAGEPLRTAPIVLKAGDEALFLGVQAQAVRVDPPAIARVVQVPGLGVRIVARREGRAELLAGRPGMVYARIAVVPGEPLEVMSGAVTVRWASLADAASGRSEGTAGEAAAENPRIDPGSRRPRRRPVSDGEDHGY